MISMVGIFDKFGEPKLSYESVLSLIETCCIRRVVIWTTTKHDKFREGHAHQLLHENRPLKDNVNRNAYGKNSRVIVSLQSPSNQRS